MQSVLCSVKHKLYCMCLVLLSQKNFNYRIVSCAVGWQIILQMSSSPTPFYSRVTKSRIPRPMKISKEEIPQPLSSPCQCSSTHTDQKQFLFFRENLECAGFCPLPLFLARGTTEEGLPLPSLDPFPSNIHIQNYKIIHFFQSLQLHR